MEKMDELRRIHKLNLLRKYHFGCRARAARFLVGGGGGGGGGLKRKPDFFWGGGGGWGGASMLPWEN